MWSFRMEHKQIERDIQIQNALPWNCNFSLTVSNYVTKVKLVGK